MASAERERLQQIRRMTKQSQPSPEVDAFFAHCYRLGYAVRRGGQLDRAHHRLARLHLRLGADYAGPDMPIPPKPKWMRWKTYGRIHQQIDAGREQLDVVFAAGAQRILARLERSEHRSKRPRWTQDLRWLR